MLKELQTKLEQPLPIDCFNLLILLISPTMNEMVMSQLLFMAGQTTKSPSGTSLAQLLWCQLGVAAIEKE